MDWSKQRIDRKTGGPIGVSCDENRITEASTPHGRDSLEASSASHQWVRKLLFRHRYYVKIIHPNTSHRGLIEGGEK